MANLHALLTWVEMSQRHAIQLPNFSSIYDTAPYLPPVRNNDIEQLSQASLPMNCSYQSGRSISEARKKSISAMARRSRDMTPEQMNHLKQNWRESTKRTYRSAWKRWCLWTNQNNVSHSTPDGRDLSNFLLELLQKEGYSYNTVLLHKSVVCSLCEPGETILSSHPLVLRVMKSAVGRPRHRPPPAWPVDALTNWMSGNFSKDVRLYDCSRRTATLLLLCSGRRVRDLTHLDAGDGSCVIKEDSVTFWPKEKFSEKRRGWVLKSNRTCLTLDPVFWVKTLLVLSRSRREGKCLSSLFVTVFGQPKPASRTSISNWVKSLLKDAGVAAAPRGPGRGRDALLDYTADEILAQGSWSADNQMTPFYEEI